MGTTWFLADQTAGHLPQPLSRYDQIHVASSYSNFLHSEDLIVRRLVADRLLPLPASVQAQHGEFSLSQSRDNQNQVEREQLFDLRSQRA